VCNRTNKVVFIILAITAIAGLVFLSIVEMTRIALQIIAAQRSARKRRHQHQAAPIAEPPSSPSADQTSPTVESHNPRNRLTVEITTAHFSALTIDRHIRPGADAPAATSGRPGTS